MIGLCFLSQFYVFSKAKAPRIKNQCHSLPFQSHPGAKVSRNNSNIKINHPFLLSVASYEFPEVTVLILYACSGWWEM